MNIYKKLNNARTKFHSQECKKSGHNKFAGYRYHELHDILLPALKAFDESGLCAVISFSTEQAVMTIYETEGDGVITITSPMAEAPLKGTHPIQQIGAVETYSRRYLWVAALEIVEHDGLEAVTASPAGVDEDAALQEWVAELEACESLEELRNVTKTGMDALKKISPGLSDRLKNIAKGYSINLSNKEKADG
jgi:ERF superfamily